MTSQTARRTSAASEDHRTEPEAHSTARECARLKNGPSVEVSYCSREGAAGLRSAHAGHLAAGDRTLLPPNVRLATISSARARLHGAVGLAKQVSKPIRNREARVTEPHVA